VVFAGTERLERDGNVLLLPHHSPVYVPDLIAAADAVVGKLGYSTVAEAWGAGARYIYVPRRRFPEGPFLADFVKRRLLGLEVEAAAFNSGDWLDGLPTLLA
jgi:UDP-N-acetylglucosamine:LPS N-acetylglucosamine transferase